MVWSNLILLSSFQIQTKEPAQGGKRDFEFLPVNQNGDISHRGRRGKRGFVRVSSVFSAASVFSLWRDKPP
jgi:hypothetical protein